MPKATALWLLRNTQLTRGQISTFCGLHPLELNVLSQTQSLHAWDPVLSGQLTREEILRCETDPESTLALAVSDDEPPARKPQKWYTPLSKRAEIPHAILWIIKAFPEISDARVCQVLPTTRTMVKNIREGRYWNTKGLTPKDPVLLGLCSAAAIQALEQSAN
jgi:uncharacterized protein